MMDKYENTLASPNTKNKSYIYSFCIQFRRDKESEVFVHNNATSRSFLISRIDKATVPFLVLFFCSIYQMKYIIFTVNFIEYSY